MFYAISDLHGCYEKYKQMLKILRFSDDDTLYVLGDTVDRGEDGIKILQDMMSRVNIIPFWGNHDYMAYHLLHIFYKLKEDSLEKRNGTKQNHLSWETQPLIETTLLKMEEYHRWMEIGGRKTFEIFLSLDRDTQKNILDYMNTFHYFREVTVNGRMFFLSHTIPDKDKMLDFEGSHKDIFFKDKPEYEYYFLTSVPEYEKRYFEDRYIVTGHIPTGYIDKNSIGRIYSKNGHIAIDCGAVFGGPLGCICLDTLEKFYTIIR